MVNSFANYLKFGKVKKQIKDPELAKSLLEQSFERLQYIQEKEISKRNAKFVLEDAYEAVRESAQALMAINGYKPYSHEATISFVIKYYSIKFSEEDIALFNHYRELRNNSVYKAVPILPADAKDCIIFAEKFIKKVKSIGLE